MNHDDNNTSGAIRLKDQPKGLLIIMATQVFQSFSYYAIYAVLLFYMIGSPQRGGLHYDATTAASIMSIFGALTYASGVFGGFISDRFLGPSKSVLIGSVLCIFTSLILVFPSGRIGLWCALILNLVGASLYTPNLSDMIGTLYGEHDKRRVSGYTLFYASVNIGAALGPFIDAWLGQAVDYHLGFGVAAISMTIGVLVYFYGQHHQLKSAGRKAVDPVDSASSRRNVIKGLAIILVAIIVVLLVMKAIGILSIANVITLITIVSIIIPIGYFIYIYRSDKLSSVDQTHLIAYVFIFVSAVFFWSVYEQTMVVYPLFASTKTSLSIFGLHLQAAQLTGFNGFFCVIWAPIATYLWDRLGKRNPSPVGKFLIGIVSVAIGIMVPGFVLLANGGAKMSIWWLVLSIAIIEIGEIILSPAGMNLTNLLSPKAFYSQLMSLWYVGIALGQSINSQIVKLYHPESAEKYFLLVGLVALIFAFILFLLRKRVNKMIAQQETTA